MYNLWGFKLPPTVTASLWSSFPPGGPPSGSILILQWNCRPSLLLVLPSVLSSSIVPPLHRLLLSHSVHVGTPSKRRKKLRECFYITFFLLLLSFLESVSLPFHDSHILIAPYGGHLNHKLSVFCPVRLHCFIFTLFVFAHLTSCLTKHSTACLYNKAWL